MNFNHLSQINHIQIIEQKYNSNKYFYIADNPKKDFYAPNQLGWNTILLKQN